MQQSNQEISTYQVEEIDLRKLVKSLKERRWFIFGFTGIATLLAILYTLSLPPLPYEIKAGFLKPDKTSLHEINKSKLLESFITTDFTATTEERLHSSFLKKLNNKTFQINTFIEGGYLTKLNKENKPIDDVDKYVSGFLNSVSIELGEIKKNENTGVLFILDPSIISMQVAHTETDLSIEFIDELIAKADKETVADYIKHIKQFITSRLNAISLERRSLILFNKRERLSYIDELTTAAKMAHSLGITDARYISWVNMGNSSIQSIGEVDDTNLTTFINDGQNLPNWYLYGEKALEDTIRKLSKVDDEKEFSAKNLIELDIERNELESITLDPSKISTMQIDQSAIARQISYKSWNKKLIVVMVLLSSFALSIVLSLLINLFKEDETEPTTKTSR